MSPLHNWVFWIAVAGATLFRVLSQPVQPMRLAFAGAFGGVFAAVFFTDPILAYLNANPDTYKAAAAALLTLTGESIMRLLIIVSRDPAKGIELWKQWRGK
jgi:hypothetical protein